MRVIFFRQVGSEKSPVYDFIKRLQPKDRLRILASLKNIEELGFDSPRVQFRQIRGKLWEIKIRTSTVGFRVFYVTIKKETLVLLHAFKKQSQKTPLKEIEIAEKRMMEVLENEELYNA